jgi:hypothetical protein
LLPAPGGRAEAETLEFTGAQGQYLGRPGRVSVALQFEQRVLRSVSIIGEAVIVFAARSLSRSRQAHRQDFTSLDPPARLP